MGKKRFYNKLVEINNLPFSKHKQELIDTYENWKQETEQINDILLIGIKVS